ncbi:MAG: glycosyltransferase family 2 protein [Eubacteriales bacterium]
MEPLLSVIVPVYNVEPYLRKCVDSILNQTYRNLEVILVDDGSPDNCGAICEEYAANDARVRVLHKPNGGLSDARNAGMDIITGEYLTFVDSDDWLQPELYRNAMQMCPFAISVFGCTFVNEDGEEISAKTPCTQTKPITTLSDDSEIERLVHSSLLGYACNKIYCTALIHDLRFGNFPLREDLVFNLEAFSRAAQILLLDECGYCYLQRGNSTLHSLYSGPIPDAFPALEKMITIPLVKDQKKSQKNINHLVKVYLTDFIYKYIAFNPNLSAEEKKNNIKKLFHAPIVRKILRFYRGEGKLLFVFTFCYKINAPGLFYFFLKGIWADA